MATPVEWLAAFQVNTGAAANSGDNVFDPQIIGLEGGNFLVAWSESGIGGVASAAGTDIIGKIFDAEGNLVRDSYQLNSFQVDNETDFDIAPLNGGGFILVFMDNDLSGGSLTDRTTVRFRIFDEDGNLGIGGTVATENVAADFLANPTVVVNNTDNSFYVTFTDDVGADTDIRSVRYNSDGTVATAEFSAAQNSPDRDADGDTAININGELVSIYEETDVGTVGIEMRVYNAAGVFQHSANVDNGPAGDPHVATLTNGNIVAVWQDGTTVQYRVYDSNLVAIAGPFTVDASGDSHNEPEIVALQDGGFVIVWDNDTDNTLEARRFTETGAVTVGDTVTVIEPVAGAELSPNVGVTSDGRVLFTYEQGNDIFATIWDTRGTTITAADYAGLPLNFIDGEVITSNVIDSTVVGDGGDDTILGQDGNNLITGDTGRDSIEGGGGDDTIEGGFATDTIDGGTGNDLFIVRNSEFSDDIVGGPGTDTLDLALRTTGSGVDFDGNAGTYDLQGPVNTISEVETVLGTQLDDTLSGRFNNGADIFGNDGDDIWGFGIGDGFPNFDGGNGDDTVDFSAFSTDFFVDMVNGAYEFNSATGPGTDGRILNVESYIGSAGIDNVIGNAAANDINVGAGNDTVNAGTGQDTVTGLGGNDLINLDGGVDLGLGGGGNDTINGGAAGDEIQGGSGSDVLNGDSGADSIDGGSGGDTINGGTSNDTINGGNAADVINGGDGNDLINGEGFTDTINGGNNNDTITGGGSSDVLNGDGGSDLIFGNNGADTIDGGSGNDSLNGGALNDEIIGGTGNDTLNGTSGDDRLTGGDGADVFFFRANNGLFDRIFDFEDGIDSIEFNISGINDISDLTLTNFLNGVDIDYGTGLIRVFGVSSSDFSNADFIF